MKALRQGTPQELGPSEGEERSKPQSHMGEALTRNTDWLISVVCLGFVFSCETRLTEGRNFWKIHTERTASVWGL